MTSFLVCLTLLVIDATTLRCDGRELRLWGIAAPAGADAGAAARRRLAELTRGREVRCDIMGDEGGRTTAKCTAGDTDLACALIRGGHATEVVAQTRGAYAQCTGGKPAK
jgi:endonuclease YncB( thermonuclease family)